MSLTERELAEIESLCKPVKPPRMTREELRAWLDRNLLRDGAGWRFWFEVDGEGEYLGERSARTGPDPVETKQRCTCSQCRPTEGDK